MVPFIQPAPASAPSGPSSNSDFGPTASPRNDPFELAMNRALAKDRKGTDVKSSSAPPARRLSRQRSPAPADAGTAPLPGATGSTPDRIASDTPAERGVSLKETAPEGAPGPAQPAADPALVGSSGLNILQALVVPTTNTVQLAQEHRPHASGQGPVNRPDLVEPKPEARRDAKTSLIAKASPGESNPKAAPTISGASAKGSDVSPTASSKEQGTSSTESASETSSTVPTRDVDGKVASMRPDSRADPAAASEGPAPPAAPGLVPGTEEHTPSEPAGPSVIAASTIPTAASHPEPGKDVPQSLGTSAAQQETAMKKAEKMQKSADLPQQNLPGNGAVSACQDDFRTAALQNGPVPAQATAVTDARLVSLERTHDLVAMHALRVNQTSNETLRVVIEPGGGTRLSLELRYNNGQVDAQAELHRGDFEFLKHHWTGLQQQLESRGVNLGPLGCSTQSATDQRSSRNPNEPPADEQLARSAFAEFALDGSIGSSATGLKGQTKTHPGWESWA